jgi:hypothetical protein
MSNTIKRALNEVARILTDELIVKPAIPPLEP